MIGFSLALSLIIIIIIIIIIKTLFQEGNTISTKLISLAALKYLQMNNLQMNKDGLNDMTDGIRAHEISDIQANT